EPPGTLHRGLCGLGIALGDEREGGQRRLGRGGAGAGLVGDEGVGAQGRTLEGGGALGGGARRQGDRGALDADEGPGGGAEGESEVLRGSLREILLTHTDQQQRGRGGQSVGGDAVQIAACGGGVETGDGLGDLRRTGDGRGGAVGSGEQGEDEDVGADVAHGSFGDGDGGHGP